MKTLYESILDDDTRIMGRADKKAAAYLERKKKIDLVLDAFEELTLDWGLKFSHGINYGTYTQIDSKNAVARYFVKHNKVNSGKQEFMDGYRFLKDKFASIWDECIPEENLLIKNPSASFIFKDLGIKIWISLDNRSGTQSIFDTFSMICFDKSDKYVGDNINKLVKKIS